MYSVSTPEVQSGGGKGDCATIWRSKGDGQSNSHKTHSDTNRAQGGVISTHILITLRYLLTVHHRLLEQDTVTPTENIIILLQHCANVTIQHLCSVMAFLILSTCSECILYVRSQLMCSHFACSTVQECSLKSDHSSPLSLVPLEQYVISIIMSYICVSFQSQCQGVLVCA